MIGGWQQNSADAGALAPVLSLIEGAAAALDGAVAAHALAGISLADHATFARSHFDRHEFERARFHFGLATKNNVSDGEALWLAIGIERKLGNQSAENDLAVQLRRRYPSSSEYAAYQRGAFDE